ncbi:hypothetical protein [Thermoactinospora rubra]|uniref:hypothetical protein n=1 Tax=Thermoactinospora rubra TaxID=1088767 RepID=UPI001301BA43|nr:hypothetical protein [Thermoactinospora rubra]
MYVLPMRLPSGGGRPSAEYVRACVVSFFGSWENALRSEDGRAVIARYIAPPDGLDP